MVDKARGFLLDRKQVKVTVMLRGRQKGRPEQALELLRRFSGDLEDCGSLAKEPSSDTLGMTLNPKRSAR